MGVSFSPGHAVAIAIGLLGLGFIAMAIVKDGANPMLLILGFGLVVAGFITAGLRVLMGNSASTPNREDA